MNGPSISFRWRRATTAVLIVGLVLILVALVTSYVAATFRPTIQVKVASGVYNAWTAMTEAERVQGLSGIKELPAGGGLLMDFKEDGQWGIWMKDMKIPLDIVWLNKDKKVIYIVKNASPALGTGTKFIPKDQARYVLELPAGTVDKAAIKVGTIASFDEEALK